MTLYEKIKTLYPELTNYDFQVSIFLRNQWDGKGDYIEKWDHPVYPRPTQEQLDALG